MRETSDFYRLRPQLWLKALERCCVRTLRFFVSSLLSFLCRQRNWYYPLLSSSSARLRLCGKIPLLD